MQSKFPEGMTYTYKRVRKFAPCFMMRLAEFSYKAAIRRQTFL